LHQEAEQVEEVIKMATTMQTLTEGFGRRKATMACEACRKRRVGSSLEDLFGEIWFDDVSGKMLWHQALRILLSTRTVVHFRHSAPASRAPTARPAVHKRDQVPLAPMPRLEVPTEASKVDDVSASPTPSSPVIQGKQADIPDVELWREHLQVCMDAEGGPTDR
jgi:hypothetical protein